MRRFLRLVVAWPKSREQLEFHALGCLWSGQDFAHHIRPRRKIKLLIWLACAAHIAQHRLLKVPLQQLVGWPTRVVEQPPFQACAPEAVRIRVKKDKGMSSLTYVSKMHE